MPPNKFPVMEFFYTIQGEGYNTGKAAFFIRLAGCDVGCVWCDVKESWDAGKHSIKTIDELITEIKKTPAKNVVITGGEPCMYNLEPLTGEFHAAGLEMFLETSGAYPLTGIWDWVCVSPKKFKFPLPASLQRADELKVVVYNQSDYKWAEKNSILVRPGCRLFLQPEYSVREKVMPGIIEYVKQNPEWRISIQQPAEGCRIQLAAGPFQAAAH